MVFIMCIVVMTIFEPWDFIAACMLEIFLYMQKDKYVLWN